MLDLTIFEDRLFAAATGAAFINGLSRFALLFVFVFYFQGAQGDDPITAGIKLAPLAIGMLVASPLAGPRGRPARLARRWPPGAWWSRPSGLALMTTLQAGQPLLAEQPLAADRRRRVWPVQLAQHRRDDGRRARRTGAASPPARGRCSRTPARSISIAFVLAIVTAAIPQDVLFKIFSGLASGLTDAQLEPFIHNMHMALCVLALDLAGRRGRFAPAPRAAQLRVRSRCTERPDDA